MHASILKYFVEVARSGSIRKAAQNLFVASSAINRQIRKRGADLIYLAGPGHGGPGMVANAYLDGTYSELYSGVTRDDCR